MENKEQLMVKYRNMKNLRDIVLILNALSFLGLISSLLLWLITFNDQPHTLHKLSETLCAIQFILFPCCLLYTSPSPRD